MAIFRIGQTAGRLSTSSSPAVHSDGNVSYDFNALTTPGSSQLFLPFFSPAAGVTAYELPEAHSLTPGYTARFVE